MAVLTSLEWTADITCIALFTARDVVLSFDGESEGARKEDTDESDG